MTEDAIAEKIRKLRTARDAVRKAEDDLQTATKTLFPKGAPLRWKRGTRLQFGQVESHGYGGSLFVINSKTAATIKISVYDLVQALDQEEAA